MLLSSQLHIYNCFIGHLLLVMVGMSAGRNPNCQYSKQQGYQTADCSERKLQNVPKNLRSEIEVLDLSVNQIRELHNDSFTCCTSIKLLYLQWNYISEVDSHTFYPLSGMIVLDFSTNALSKLPQNLPSGLRRLFLDSNPSLFPDKENPVLPITSITSLETLQLSSNKLKKFPQFVGNVPSLIELNITNNPLTSITADDLAPLCQLQYLHISSDKLFTPDTTSSSCECSKLERWISARSIMVTPLICRKDTKWSKNLGECNTEPTNMTVTTYESCVAELNSRKLPYRLMVISGIVVLLVGIFILLYVRHRRRQREKSKSVATSTAIGHNSRTPPNVKCDNQTLEDKCTNYAFEYKGPGGRSQAPGAPPSWETPV